MNHLNETDQSKPIYSKKDTKGSILLLWNKVKFYNNSQIFINLKTSRIGCNIDEKVNKILKKN